MAQRERRGEREREGGRRKEGRTRRAIDVGVDRRGSRGGASDRALSADGHEGCQGGRVYYSRLDTRALCGRLSRISKGGTSERTLPASVGLNVAVEMLIPAEEDAAMRTAARP